MSHNHSHTNRKKFPLRRKLLLWGLTGGILVIGGEIGASRWSSFFKPSPSPTLYTYAGHPSGVSSVAWSPDGTRIASVGWDSTIQIWNASNGQHLLTYQGHPDARRVAWSPDSTRIASAGTKFTVQVWNASNGRQIWTYQNYQGTPSYAIIAWSHDGRQIASEGEVESGAIEVRNASDGHLLLNYHHPYVTSFSWSPDSTRIASSGWYRSVQVWRAHDGQKIWFYPIPDPNDDYINHVDAITWSPDGAHIVSSGSCPDILFANNEGIQIWDASTGKKIRTYRGHDGRSDIKAVTWSPDGKQMASGATDKTVQVWNATNGKGIFTYQEHTDDVDTVAWSPDGTRIASGGRDRFVRVWQVVYEMVCSHSFLHNLSIYRCGALLKEERTM